MGGLAPGVKLVLLLALLCWLSIRTLNSGLKSKQIRPRPWRVTLWWRGGGELGGQQRGVAQTPFAAATPRLYGSQPSWGFALFSFHLWTRQAPNGWVQDPQTEQLHGKARFKDKVSCEKTEAGPSINLVCSHQRCNSRSYKRTGSGALFCLIFSNTWKERQIWYRLYVES